MGTTKKDENKVITTEVQSQQGGQDSQDTPKKDLVTNDPIAQRIAKRKELRDEIVKPLNEVYLKTPTNPNKQSESINPYKEEVESKTPVFDMQTMINDLNAREEEALKKNEEERKKESRYHRARSIISAIGDGLSGLANIYFTTKGAPDMLKGTTSMSAKQQERWDKIRKEREARREAYLKAVRDNNRESLKNAYTQWKDNRDYELKVQQEERQKRQAEVKAMKDEAMALYYSNKASKEEYLAMVKAAEAGDYDKFSKLRAREIESKINKNNAQAANAGKSGGSGSKNYTKTKTIMVPVRDGRGRITGYEEVEVTETKEYGRVSNSKKSWSAKKNRK